MQVKIAHLGARCDDFFSVHEIDEPSIGYMYAIPCNVGMQQPTSNTETMVDVSSEVQSVAWTAVLAFHMQMRHIKNARRMYTCVRILYKSHNTELGIITIIPPNSPCPPPLRPLQQQTPNSSPPSSSRSPHPPQPPQQQHPRPSQPYSNRSHPLLRSSGILGWAASHTLPSPQRTPRYSST